MINSFFGTNLEAVVQVIAKNPARFQLAHKLGNLFDEVCVVTHYGDNLDNRNIISVQKICGMRGSMQVICDDQPCVIDKKDGVNTIMSNILKIVQDERIVKYFGVVQTKKSDRLEDRISRVIWNQGMYMPRENFYNKVPQGSLPENQHALMLSDFCDNLLRYHSSTRISLIVPFGMRAFRHQIVFEHGNWWQEVGRTGWAICENSREVVTNCVMTFLSVVQNDISTEMVSLDPVSDRMCRCKCVLAALTHMRHLEFTNLVYDMTTERI